MWTSEALDAGLESVDKADLLPPKLATTYRSLYWFRTMRTAHGLDSLSPYLSNIIEILYHEDFDPYVQANSIDADVPMLIKVLQYVLTS